MAVGGDGAVEIRDARDPGGRVNEARQGEVHFLHGNFGVERSFGGIVSINGAGFAVDFEASVSWQLSRYLEGKRRGEREVRHLNIHLVVHVRLLR
jgi:hypothetical protein